MEQLIRLGGFPESLLRTSYVTSASDETEPSLLTPTSLCSVTLVESAVPAVLDSGALNSKALCAEMRS